MELGGLYQTIGKGLLITQTPGAGFTQVSRGLSTAATRSGVGVLAMTLAQPVTPAGAVVKAAVTSGAIGSGITVTPDGTGTVWTITTTVAGAAADVSVSVTIEQLDGT